MTWSPQIDTEGAYLLYCIMQCTAFFLCFKVSQKNIEYKKNTDLLNISDSFFSHLTLKIRKSCIHASMTHKLNYSYELVSSCIQYWEGCEYCLLRNKLILKYEAIFTCRIHGKLRSEIFIIIIKGILAENGELWHKNYPYLNS